MVKNNCNNCLSNRFAIKARGLCRRCYFLTRKLEVVKHWNLKEIETLKSYPRDSIFHNQESFVKIKKGFTEQLQARLPYLKINEQILNSKVNGSDIVPMFQRVARLAGARNKDFLWHEENLFDHNFTPKQKKILYKILNDIIESIPWRGINWNEVFRDKLNL